MFCIIIFSPFHAKIQQEKCCSNSCAKLTHTFIYNIFSKPDLKLLLKSRSKIDTNFKPIFVVTNNCTNSICCLLKEEAHGSPFELSV